MIAGRTLAYEHNDQRGRSNTRSKDNRFHHDGRVLPAHLVAGEHKRRLLKGGWRSHLTIPESNDLRLAGDANLMNTGPQSVDDDAAFCIAFCDSNLSAAETDLQTLFRQRIPRTVADAILQSTIPAQLNVCDVSRLPLRSFLLGSFLVGSFLIGNGSRIGSRSQQQAGYKKRSPDQPECSRCRIHKGHPINVDSRSVQPAVTGTCIDCSRPVRCGLIRTTLSVAKYEIGENTNQCDLSAPHHAALPIH